MDRDKPSVTFNPESAKTAILFSFIYYFLLLSFEEIKAMQWIHMKYQVLFSQKKQ